MRSEKRKLYISSFFFQIFLCVVFLLRNKNFGKVFFRSNFLPFPTWWEIRRSPFFQNFMPTKHTHKSHENRKSLILSHLTYSHETYFFFSDFDLFFLLQRGTHERRTIMTRKICGSFDEFEIKKKFAQFGNFRNSSVIKSSRSENISLLTF